MPHPSLTQIHQSSYSCFHSDIQLGSIYGGPLVLLNLVDSHGGQGQLGQAFKTAVDTRVPAGRGSGGGSGGGDPLAHAPLASTATQPQPPTFLW